ncbi:MULTISPECIES: cell division protein ZapA [unclassified Psychrobacter]|uniref:cell division protein ZapA n=1 Tax=unclassified Psychrobacter TaxID=196806 RepID=UPI0025FE6631|nr:MULTISPECIES: cell division protein ZapA [unclassified Psychrobacter]
MTDDRANPLERQLQSSQTHNIQPKNTQSTATPAKDNQTQTTQPQKAMPNNSNTQNSSANNNVNSNANSTVSSSAAKPESAPEPQIKKVDVAIAGVTYPIFCPVHEQEELHSAVSYINDFALKLRKEAPGLSQENLLVLSCLNLYEKIQTYERNEEDRLQQSKQSDALLNKIMQDAHSIL